MRKVMESIVEDEKRQVTEWESRAYEIDEAQLLIALIIKRGYSVGDGDIVMAEYDSSDVFSPVDYAHAPKIDGLMTELVAAPIDGEDQQGLDPDSFDPNAILYEIDFRNIAEKIADEEDILAEPRHVYAKYLLEMLRRYQQPYAEFDE
jgi:hypothetical protein